MKNKMTDEKALQILKHREKTCVENFTFNTCDECEEKCIYPNVINALEKQIPNGANMILTDYSDGEEVVEYYECPRCNVLYEIEYVGYLKYCAKCGQAIEWSEEDD